VKRYWQSTSNPRVIVSFDQHLDNLSMEEHPEYIEVKQDGTPKGKPKSDQREPWQMPVTRVSTGGGKKGK
jgi:hypothetical protein